MKSREVIDIEEHEPMRFDELVQGLDPKIGKVLVVGGVKFIVANKIEDIGHLQNPKAVGAQASRHTLNKTVRVMDMRQDIRGKDGARGSITTTHPIGCGRAPVTRERRDPFSPRFAAEVQRGIDPDDVLSLGFEIGKKATVIRADVQHPFALL